MIQASHFSQYNAHNGNLIWLLPNGVHESLKFYRQKNYIWLTFSEILTIAEESPQVKCSEFAATRLFYFAEIVYFVSRPRRGLWSGGSSRLVSSGFIQGLISAGTAQNDVSVLFFNGSFLDGHLKPT